MESATCDGLYSMGQKRLKLSPDRIACVGMVLPASMHIEPEQRKPNSTSAIVDYSDPLVTPNFLEGLNEGDKYNSTEKDIKAFLAQTHHVLNPLFAEHPKLSNFTEEEKGKLAPELAVQLAPSLAENNVIDMEDDCVDRNAPAASTFTVIIDSNEEQTEDQWPSYSFEEVFMTQPSDSFKDVILPQPSEQVFRKGLGVTDHVEETETNKDPGVYVGVEDEESIVVDDGLGDAWMEMSMAIESLKDVTVDPLSEETMADGDCEHSFVLKDDLGYVCCICGVIGRGIDTIFEFQYNKEMLKERSIIIDEEHTPQNDSTNIVQSIAKSQTHGEIVLSETICQNHVKEVSNILNLVRPKFFADMKKPEDLPGLGTSDGQTKIFREGDNDVLYAQNVRVRKWDKIGKVVNGPDDCMKHHEGSEYTNGEAVCHSRSGHGTTIVVIQLVTGIIIAVDSRSRVEAYVPGTTTKVKRIEDFESKLFIVTDGVYFAGAGSAQRMNQLFLYLVCLTDRGVTSIEELLGRAHTYLVEHPYREGSRGIEILMVGWSPTEKALLVGKVGDGYKTKYIMRQRLFDAVGSGMKFAKAFLKEIRDA